MSKQAQLYRMVSDKHLCPFGLKSLDLLKRRGFEVVDHKLKNSEETESFKQQHQVKTTPQVYIDNERIGGYDDLRSYFRLPPEKAAGVTYKPVIAIFLSCFYMALALSWQQHGTFASLDILSWFIAFSMVVLAIQKLRDVVAFSNQFITYDLLAMRQVPYAYVYPFAEIYVGLGMLAALPAIVISPVALFIGSIGAASVIKAVYIDKRELKCACVGGNSNVPLGFVSLTENLFMIFAAFWMFLR